MGSAQIFELQRRLNREYKSRACSWKLLLEQQQKQGQQHKHIYHSIKPPINLTKANWKRRPQADLNNQMKSFEYLMTGKKIFFKEKKKNTIWNWREKNIHQPAINFHAGN